MGSESLKRKAPSYLEFTDDNIAVSKLGNPALLGKNTFQISLQNIPVTFNMEVDVKVSLPSGEACPVKIQPSGPQSWSVSYFISPPCPNQVVVTVTVNGVQPRGSPFQLQCRNEMAVGTRVQKERDQQKGGTVLQPPNPMTWDLIKDMVRYR